MDVPNHLVALTGAVQSIREAQNAARQVVRDLPAGVRQDRAKELALRLVEALALAERLEFCLELDHAERQHMAVAR